ncbi:hypothetical protein FKM82_016414 [Ascaphus truei]
MHQFYTVRGKKRKCLLLKRCLFFFHSNLLAAMSKFSIIHQPLRNSGLKSLSLGLISMAALLYFCRHYCLFIEFAVIFRCGGDDNRRILKRSHKGFVFQPGDVIGMCLDVCII